MPPPTRFPASDASNEGLEDGDYAAPDGHEDAEDAFEDGGDAADCL